MNNILRKTIRRAGVLVCICGAVVVIAAMACLLLHIRPAVVVSGSMEPAIHTGSMVFIDMDYRADHVVERDIIAYDANGTMVTHRVKELTDEGFVTKGDANSDPDPATVSFDRYTGRVIMWIPWIGYVTRFMFQTRGKVLIIATFVSIMLIYSLLGKEETDGTEKNTGSADNSAA